MKSLGNLVRICIHFEGGAGGGTLSNWNLAAKQSSDIQSSQQHRGEGGDKSQGRVYEMSSGGCYADVMLLGEPGPDVTR